MKERVMQIISEQFNIEVDELKSDMNFKEDFNADSIELLELILALEDEFNMEMPEDDVMKIATIGDVLEYIDELED